MPEIPSLCDTPIGGKDVTTLKKVCTQAGKSRQRRRKKINHGVILKNHNVILKNHGVIFQNQALIFVFSAFFPIFVGVGTTVFRRVGQKVDNRGLSTRACVALKRLGGGGRPCGESVLPLPHQRPASPRIRGRQNNQTTIISIN
jgi:hypothetical protein